jgi:hypothetical protein
MRMQERARLLCFVCIARLLNNLYSEFFSLSTQQLTQPSVHWYEESFLPPRSARDNGTPAHTPRMNKYINKYNSLVLNKPQMMVSEQIAGINIKENNVNISHNNKPTQLMVDSTKKFNSTWIPQDAIEKAEKKRNNSFNLPSINSSHITQNTTQVVNTNSTWILDDTVRLESSNLPKWMKDYFEWHGIHKQTMNETNWQSYQYMVLKCTSLRCGGTSDRLKPIPYFLRLAYETERIFLIRWNRPCRLEEFLQPHIVNWSVPSWLESIVDAKVGSLRQVNRTDVTITGGSFQVDDGGEGSLASLVGENNTHDYKYMLLYHDLFHIMF